MLDQSSTERPPKWILVHIERAYNDFRLIGLDHVYREVQQRDERSSGRMNLVGRFLGFFIENSAYRFGKWLLYTLSQLATSRVP